MTSFRQIDLDDFRRELESCSDSALLQRFRDPTVVEDLEKADLTLAMVASKHLLPENDLHVIRADFDFSGYGFTMIRPPFIKRVGWGIVFFTWLIATAATYLLNFLFPNSVPATLVFAAFFMGFFIALAYSVFTYTGARCPHCGERYVVAPPLLNDFSTLFKEYCPRCRLFYETVAHREDNFG